MHALEVVFFFFPEACGFVNETNTVLSQNFGVPSSIPDFSETVSEM